MVRMYFNLIIKNYNLLNGLKIVYKNQIIKSFFTKLLIHITEQFQMRLQIQLISSLAFETNVNSLTEKVPNDTEKHLFLDSGN